MKILVVDDEALLVKGIRFNLMNEGYEVITGSDGLDAVRLVQEQNPNLVVLDVMMPNMDGLEALEAIRQIEVGCDAAKRARVIMTTALNEVNQVDKAFQLGCEGYAVKPINTEKFLMIMDKMGLPVH